MSTDQPVSPVGRAHPGWVAVGLVAGVLALTATASPGTDRVSDVAYGGGAFYVGVQLKYGMGEQWLASTDGGRTWSSALVPPQRATAPEVEPQTWSACADDGVCYRARMVASPSSKARTERLIELQPPGSDWRVEAEPGPGPALVGLAVNPSDSSEAVAISWHSAFSRDPSGTWEEVDVVRLASAPSWVVDGVVLLGSSRATIAIGLALSVLGWLLIPTLSSKWLAQVFTLLLGSVLWALGSFWGLPVLSGMPMMWANLVWATATALVILVAHRRSPSREGPVEHLERSSGQTYRQDDLR